jgi:transposase
MSDAEASLTEKFTGNATLVERTINRLKQYRRVATRYEKRAENYLAMLTRAAILLWL